jgi:hypothetical protein
MKVLLDECVDRRLKSRLPNHEVHTVTDMQWNGLKNGVLMSAAIGEEFDVFLTIDKNLEFQQNLKKHNIIIAVFDVKQNNIKLYEPLLPAFEAQLPTFIKGVAYRIQNQPPTVATQAASR